MSTGIKAYYLDDSIIKQTITKLPRLIRASSFNSPLMQRNFLSWKRGLQISYLVCGCVRGTQSLMLGTIASEVLVNFGWSVLPLNLP
jgi:hypothetical protein